MARCDCVASSHSFTTAPAPRDWEEGKMTFFSKKGRRNFREKLTAESAACPGCLCRDRACGQVGRLLLRGPQDWSSTS